MQDNKNLENKNRETEQRELKTKLKRRFYTKGYVSNNKGTMTRISKKKRRNDPCDCGCGKKAKNCTIAPVR